MDTLLIPFGFMVPRPVLLCAFNTQLICAIIPVQHVSVVMKSVSDLSVRRAFVVFQGRCNFDNVGNVGIW